MPRKTTVKYFKGFMFFYCGLFVWGVMAAFFYRLPVPLVGYVGPMGEFPTTSLASSIESALFALFFYSILGGFGPCLGLVVGSVFLLDKYNLLSNAKLMFISVITSSLPVLLLSNLDHLIGEW